MSSTVWSSVRLILVCALYLMIVVTTSRGFIAAPIRRSLDKEAGRRLAEAKVLVAANSQCIAANEIIAAITSTLSRIAVEKRAWWRGLFWVFDSPMTKLYADTRELNAACREAVGLRPDSTLNACAAPVIEKLSAIDPKAAKELGPRFAATGDPDSRRIIIQSAQLLIHSRQEADLAAEFDSQRFGLWLAIVGLFGVVGVGLTFPEHKVTLLFGALGGFLAPLLRINTGQKVMSWGVMVLSPVGGALTSVGGLLLVQLLSDPRINVLGAVFQENSWTKPDSVLSLALALLFGFSGRLFSRLALAGATQLAPHSDGKKKPGSL